MTTDYNNHRLVVICSPEFGPSPKRKYKQANIAKSVARQAKWNMLDDWRTQRKTGWMHKEISKSKIWKTRNKSFYMKLDTQFKRERQHKPNKVFFKAWKNVSKEERKKVRDREESKEQWEWERERGSTEEMCWEPVVRGWGVGSSGPCMGRQQPKQNGFQRERETEGKNNNHVRQDRVNRGTVVY